VRILITGGAGFIGSNLARMAALDPGISDIRIIDDFSTGLRRNLDGLKLELIEGSILDRSRLDLAMSGCEAVVHLAALASVPRSVKDPIATHHANATGTLEVLEAARRHRVSHVVVASSSSVYGANPALPKGEREWIAPLSPYAASKAVTEGYAMAFQATYQLPALAFRFFNVYGPRQRHDHPYAAAVPKFVHAALAGQPLLVHSDGLQSRDFTHVDSVCGVIVDALRRRVCSPEPVNLAFGTRASLLELISQLEQILRRPLQVVHEPERVGDVRHSEADSSRLRSLFPAATAIDLPAGLRSTVEWFQGELMLAGTLETVR
jgi:UDP-glucose 4-epimerase